MNEYRIDVALELKVQYMKAEGEATESYSFDSTEEEPCMFDLKRGAEQAIDYFLAFYKDRGYEPKKVIEQVNFYPIQEQPEYKEFDVVSYTLKELGLENYGS